MSNLSKETRERIEADALKYAEMIPDCLPHISYRRGALTEAENTQELVRVLKKVASVLSWMEDSEFRQTLRKVVEPGLAKYKEVGNG